MGKYRKYKNGGFLRSLADSGKIGDFLKSDLAKSLGTLGVGAFERARAKRALEAGIGAREEAAKDQTDVGKKAYEKMLEKLRARPAVTQASEDYIQAQKEAAEALMGAGDKRLQEQRSDIVSALQSGDPRSAAGIVNTLEQLNLGDDERRAKVLGLKTAADAQRAALTEREKDFQSALDQMVMERGAMGADEGRRTLLDLAERKQAAGPAATASGMQTAIALAALLKDYEPGNPGEGDDTDDGNRKYGGIIKAEAGMRYLADQGFKTKGEFNHDTNKKAVIDEENGEKEAELTGGELVFNPDQSEMMEKLIKKGDERGLLEFMKDLMSKPQFQD